MQPKSPGHEDGSELWNPTATLMANRAALKRRGHLRPVPEDFLAVADRPTIYQAIVGVAVAAGRAAFVDFGMIRRWCCG